MPQPSQRTFALRDLLTLAAAVVALAGCNAILGNGDPTAADALDAETDGTIPDSGSSGDASIGRDSTTAAAQPDGHADGAGRPDVESIVSDAATRDASVVGTTLADAGVTPTCTVGQTRPCDPYPFAPAIPDETKCLDGTSCSSPCKSGTQTCAATASGVADWGACQGAVGPSAADTCAPGDDSNCNGVANEGCNCANGAMETCAQALGAKGACAQGTTTCSNGKWGACSIQPAASDNCAVQPDDSNCNGLANDTCPCSPGATGTCAAKLGAKGACAAGTATCNAMGTAWTCSIAPAAQDTCDPGNDANCDGVANGGCACINGMPCSDNNACTQTDTCVSGKCVGSKPVACTASDQCHTAGTCDPTSGLCSNPVAASTVMCNDGNACTSGDHCQNGTCVGATTKSCPASDQCHTAGTCDPTSGACSNPVAPSTTSCNAGVACTSGDHCQNGTCVAGASTGTTCPGSSACVDLTSDFNNCGACGTTCLSALNTTGLQCVSGKCSCVPSTPDGIFCTLPSGATGQCVAGKCLMSMLSQGCATAADCVPGGCGTVSGHSICLGSIGLAGVVDCGNAGIHCSTGDAAEGPQGCSNATSRSFPACGAGGTQIGPIACDAPSDCAVNEDCCVGSSGQTCMAQPAGGGVGSGCAAASNAFVGFGTVCDPNNAGSCPAGQTCSGMALSGFACQ